MSRAPEKSWWAEALAIARRHGRGGPSDAAEDLAQDLALATLERAEEPQRVASWLERVGRNAAVDRWRSERRRASCELVESASGPADPEALLLGRERRSVVRGALAALPRDQRRAALLRFHHDLPFAAVACRLGTEEVTARTRVHAAALGLVLLAAAQGPEAAPPPPRAAAPAAALPKPAQAKKTAAPVEAALEATAAQPERPAAVKRYIFDGDEVVGDFHRPDIIIVPGTVAAPQPSLIEIRRDLSPEMLKSLEDL